jgi:hypothetical protein
MGTQEHPMSDAKRDQSAFRRTAAPANTAILRARVDMPPTTVRLKSLTADSLELAPAWGSAVTAGSDPYNAVGHRSVNRAKTGAATRASGR